MTKKGRSPVPRATSNTLFARAANQCSLCGCEVTRLPKLQGDKIAVIGKIAHIIAISSDGPRGGLISLTENLNSYDNLILLCANCHEMIDRQEATYTIEELTRNKNQHEEYIESLKAAFPMQKNQDFLDKYIDEFRYAYEFSVKELILNSISIDNVTTDFHTCITNGLLNKHCLIIGESGQGKSLLSFYLAIRSLDSDRIPLVIEAIQFSKDIQPVLSWSRKDLLTDYFRQIELTCTVLKKKVLLVIDGYNECPTNVQVKLNLWISSFASRHDTQVIVTCQYAIKKIAGVVFTKVVIDVPTLEEKIEIAERVSEGKSLGRIKPLAEAVKTRLESRLVGAVSDEISLGSSRYAIFDFYTRQRLKDHSEKGIYILSLAAQVLDSQISFTLSIREFSRLLSDNGLFDSTDYLFESGLLFRRGDRISFGHELFLNAFAAEAIVRFSKGNVNNLLGALESPRNRARLTLIVGAIDNTSLLEMLLPQITDYNVIEDCVLGDCGSFSKDWAEAKCRQLFYDMNEDAKLLAFAIIDRAIENKIHSEIVINQNTCRLWTEQEICLIHSLPLLFIKGPFVMEVFQWIDLVDQKFVLEFNRLRPIAIEKKIAIKDSMFSQLFLGMTSTLNSVRCSTEMFFKNFNNNGWSLMNLSPSNKLHDVVADKLKQPNLSYGQLYLILLLIQQFRFNNEAWKLLIVPYLPSILGNRWKFLPYHLQNALLDSTHYLWHASEEEKRPVINALNELLAKVDNNNIFASTFIIDALKDLGALQDDEQAYEGTVRNELAYVFGQDPIEERSKAAHSVHVKTYDHPYEGAYWRVLGELNDEEKNEFRVLALSGSPDDSELGIPYLLYEVAAISGVDFKIIERFTKIPDAKDHMPQCATEVCLLAHLILAFHNRALPAGISNPNSKGAYAFKAYFELLYWINRSDVETNDKNKLVREAWIILMDHSAAVSAGILSHFKFATRETIARFAKEKNLITSISDVSRENVAEICRHAIKNRSSQKGYFRTDSKEIMNFSINQLEYFGSQVDLSILKTLVSDKAYSSSAIEAISAIEKRIS